MTSKLRHALDLAPVFIFAVLASSFLANAEESSPSTKLPTPQVSEDLTIPYSSIEVNGQNMTYLSIGSGSPVIFLHGNPTSAYLWRNILPFVGETHLAIAPDLIGMGRSDKPDIDYTFVDHLTYLEGFIDAQGFETIVLVGHDWGAALAWEYARSHPEKVQGLTFMEGVLPPSFPQASFEALGEEMGSMFRAFKDPEQGHELVIENNMFVEQVLPGFVNRPLGEVAMSEYRLPYLEKSARKPTLQWPREVPIAGEPHSTTNALNGIAAFMAETEMPVLITYVEPGVVLPPEAVSWYTDRIQNLETVYVGQGLHFIQEDQPVAIGRAIADWLRRHQE